MKQKTSSYMGNSSITAFSLYLSVIIGGGGAAPSPSYGTGILSIETERQKGDSKIQHKLFGDPKMSAQCTEVPIRRCLENS